MRKFIKGQIALGLPLVITLIGGALGAMGWVTTQITTVFTNSTSTNATTTTLTI